MKKIIEEFKFFIDEINSNYIDEHAAACSYYTILSFIPLTINSSLFSILGYG